MGAHRVAVPAVGLALTIVAALMLFVRLPAALRGVDHAAAAQAGRNAYGGALAAADSVEVDDGFVQAAMTLVPPNARFAVLLPVDQSGAEKTYGVNPTTLAAVSGLMENFLLPRREVGEPSKGDYVLCYLCDRAHWDARTRWLYTSPAVKDVLVGEMDRR